MGLRAGAWFVPSKGVKPAHGYIIAEVDVTDPDAFKRYSEKVPPIVAAFDGRYLVRGGKIQEVEGEVPKRIVVIAFESVEKARAWEYSPAYEAIKPLRHSSAKSRICIVEGIAPQ